MNEARLIQQIADRAADLFERLGITTASQEHFIRTATAAEVHIVHSEIVPLRLQELLDADDSNFAHDIGGIHRHLEIGKKSTLTAGFCPRFARMQ
ncbi:MAG: hypothetical protein J2P55_00080 [Rhizobiales bacterium]|nr:hypothetical protein [Hyphomicrobiales bacterium]